MDQSLEQLTAELAAARRRAEADLLRAQISSTLRLSHSSSSPGRTSPPRALDASASVSLDLDDSGAAIASINTSSRAVLSALRALQEKIRRLEADRRETDALLAESQRAARDAARELAAREQNISEAGEARRRLVENHYTESARLQAAVDSLTAEASRLRSALAVAQEDSRAQSQLTEHERGRVAALEARLRRSEELAAERLASASSLSSHKLATHAAAVGVAEERATAAESRALVAERALAAAVAERDAAESELSDTRAELSQARARLSAVHALNVSVVSELESRVHAVTALNKSASRGRGGLTGGSGGSGGKSPTRGRQQQQQQQQWRSRSGSSSGSRAAAASAGTTAAGSAPNGDQQWRSQLRRADASPVPTGRSTHAGSGMAATSHGQLLQATSCGSVAASLGGGGGGGVIPFLPAGVAGPSHNVLANVQRALAHSIVDAPPVSPVLTAAASGGDGEEEDEVPEGGDDDAGLGHHGTRAAGHHHPRQQERSTTPSWSDAPGGQRQRRVSSSSSSGGTSAAAASATRNRVGSSVQALPSASMDALVEALSDEAASLERQYHALCDSAAAGESGAATSAADTLSALRRKHAQLQLLQSAEPGTIAGLPVRSPVRNPEAVDKRIDVLRTVSHLKELVGCGC
jgi:hypothetical protein